jgi:hypothetical protein
MVIRSLLEDLNPHIKHLYTKVEENTESRKQPVCFLPPASSRHVNSRVLTEMKTFRGFQKRNAESRDWPNVGSWLSTADNR